ncbi:MAG: MOSC domain-containing protein [Planctomycetota bacterium]|nr:MOSC domain-containing protein [Planctomycetota bacterium]MDI6788401.1 MOSC domain-containing protein [Planctomycetota bacterium]
MAKIVGVCISDRKGIPKKNIGSAYLERDCGIKEDAHSGSGHRQISLLAKESIDKFVIQNLPMGHTPSAIGLGSFAENLTTEGIDLKNLAIGTELKVGETVRLRITQIGKDCHTKCAIFRKIGDCVMPLEGVFAEVVQSGTIKVGDEIIVE